MNALGVTMAWATMAVTVVAAIGLLLERCASARGPRAGSWIAAMSLGAIVVVSAVVFCPIGEVWSRAWPTTRPDSAIGGRSRNATKKPDRATPIPAGNRIGSAVDRTPFSHTAASLVTWLRDRVDRGADSIRVRPSRWLDAWAIVCTFGAIAGVARLLVGAWGVHDARRRSRLVNDEQLQELVESLRLAIGVVRRVELRELPELATPAAVGWRRPLILLPGDWRSWTEFERRAVVAHELAHISRTDYAAGVIARIGLALHFYHPLVHWIAARLQLHQELAADSQGAHLAGGRRPYLQALARLALKQEGRTLAWPARTFLPAQGHLIRRILVLQSPAPASDRALSLTVRTVATALVLGIGIGVSALRGPAPAISAEVPPTAAAGNTPATQAADIPFDLTYVPANSMGIVAVRPAALFGRKGMQGHRDALNALIAQFIPAAKFKVEWIDQATSALTIRTRDRAKGKPGALMINSFMLRTVKDIDWMPIVKAGLRALEGVEPNMIETQFEGRTYYLVTNCPKLGPTSGAFYFPDARTVVFDAEPTVRRVIQQAAGTKPKFNPGDAWTKVERGVFALALDNHAGELKLDKEMDDPADLPIALMVQLAQRWVVGVDNSDTMRLKAIATCGSSALGETVARHAGTFLAHIRAELDRAEKEPRKNDSRDDAEALKVARKLMSDLHVNHEGSLVDFQAETNISLGEIGAILSKGGF